MNRFILFCKTFAILIATYFALATLSCLLPDKSIKAHIADSAKKMVKEGLYPQAIIRMKQCQMDNFTDALIMNQMYNIDRKHPITSAMKMIRSSEKGRDWDQPGLLLRKVNGENLEEQHYARYWHGSTFLFRPLFLVMDFLTLRHILFIVSSLLIVLLLCAYYPKAGLMKTIALALGFLLTYGFVMQFSMQFFPVLALTIIGSLLVVKRKQSDNSGLLFFVIGSMTCYFDLLTTPLLTLGIPMAVMLSLKREDEFQFKDSIIEISKLTLLWGGGFAFTFLTKWALASLILGQNIFADAYEVSLYRMEAEEFTRWDAVTKNFDMLNLWMIGIAALVLLLFAIIKRLKINYKKVVLFFIIGLMPYVWYLLLANHSYVHWWFAYRLQAITVVCLLYMFCDGNSAMKNGKSPFFTP
ncbi:MAG: hypothetical protein IJK36_00435 [Bacteroidales bacterium]|nr:hypothetical protein [Bacteroidales bacterium]